MMQSQVIKLKKVLNNNRAWPLMLVGASADQFKDAVILTADTDEKELHPSNKQVPAWITRLEELADDGKACYLIIEGLDTVSKDVQNKFLPLLKDRRAGVYKLPQSAQILIPTKDVAAVSGNIKTLALSWAV